MTRSPKTKAAIREAIEAAQERGFADIVTKLEGIADSMRTSNDNRQGAYVRGVPRACSEP